MLLVEGAAHLVSRLELDDEPEAFKVIRMLDRQDEMLDLLRNVLAEYRVCLKIGSELPAKEIQSCSLVAAGYGQAHRNLGTVGVLGPMRMDYPTVIGSVEKTAWSLSQYIDEIF
jgi:heat-inducible transcriptional repressor